MLVLAPFGNSNKSARPAIAAKQREESMRCTV